MIDYVLWEVIENDATLPKTQVVEGVMTKMPITSAEEKAQRRLKVKARSTLMIGVPNEHQLKFNYIKDAKKLLKAVEKRFGFKSLNKADLDTMSMNDLYNNLNVYELEVKGMSSLSLSTQNMAFVSSSNNNSSSTNGAVNTAQAVNTAHGVFTASTQEGSLLLMVMRPLVLISLEWSATISTRGDIFARECKAPRNQDNKYKESSRRSVPMETSASIGLVSCDGLGGYDWSDQAEEGQNFNGEVQLHARVDGKEIVITESSVRRDLQLADEEGLTMPTDPYHTPTILQPSSSQPQKTQKPRKPKRKDTQVPQLSGPTKSITDEAVHKELGNSLVRAATTASSLEAEQDSGGGPRYQETMRDTIAQTRVESSRDEESLGANASKQGKRIDAIDADEDITLVNDADNEMFDVDDLGGEEVFVARQNDNVVEEVVNAAHGKGKGIMIEEPVKPKKKDQIRLDEEAALKLQAKIDADQQLAKRLQAQEQEELSDAEKATLFQQLLEKRRKHFAAKKAEEKRNKPPTQAQKRKIIAFKRVNTFEDIRTELVKGKEKRAGEELIQESTKKQNVEDDKENAELKQLVETIPDEEEVTIDAIPLVVKEDLKDLYKLIKARYGSTRPVENMNYLLWSDMKTMFEPHVEDEIYMLVEKKHPLTPPILSMMLEKKLQIDYESEMAYQRRIIEIKSLIDVVGITAAQVCVNTAQLKEDRFYSPPAMRRQQVMMMKVQQEEHKVQPLMQQEVEECNLDRFMKHTTPIVTAQHFPKTSMKGWRNQENSYHPYFVLGDLWESLKEWSAYGAGVPLLLNESDSVVQYYVPYLSGIQLYVDPSAPVTSRRRPGEESDSDSSRATSSDGSYEAGSVGRGSRAQANYLGSVAKSFSKLRLRADPFVADGSEEGEIRNPPGLLIFEYFERALPYHRAPLADKISDLASKFPELKTYRSCDLTQSSWVSVAWYPIYRIPVGPSLQNLDASFLTFHSLSTPLRGTDGDKLHLHGSTVTEVHYGGVTCRLSLPIFGLAVYKFKNSDWTQSGVHGRADRGVRGDSAVQLSTEHNASFASARDELRSSHPDDPKIVVLKQNGWRQRSCTDCFQMGLSNRTVKEHGVVQDKTGRNMVWYKIKRGSLRQH
nr:hypothetical protein [Tanacetum cinerariifolium]